MKAKPTARLAAFLAAVAAACLLQAAETGADAAKEAAAGWINLREALGGDFTAKPASVQTYEGTGGKGRFHVVSLEGGGFVVLSGDDGLTPVVAYSREGTFDPVPQNPLWCMLSGDTAGAAKRLEEANAQTAASGVRALGASSGNTAKWKRLRAAASPSGARALGASVASPADLRVPALVQSQWNQDIAQSGNGYSHRYYNEYVNFNGTYMPCGCVATAMAQTMRYFEWPQTAVQAKTFACNVGGVATNLTMKGGTYDWAHMPYIPANVPYDWANVVGIAKLTYDAGVSVNMSYSASGSGAYPVSIAPSLKDVFGYSGASMHVSSTGLSMDDFAKDVLPNLDAGRPVLCGVQGYATSTENRDVGHSIVADGYGYSGGTLYVHFNMGWGGSKDAWYTPASITPSGYVYETIDSIVFNIYTTEADGSPIASGRVLDADGNPITNASVVATYNGTEQATATSDTNGVYALILPPRTSSRTYNITARCDGYVQKQVVSVSASCVVSDKKASENSFYARYSSSNSHGNDIAMEASVAATAPIVSPKSGTVFFTPRMTVEIESAMEGAEIRYTLDGSDPTAESALYSGPFEIAQTTTVKARVFAPGYLDSAVATSVFRHLALIGDNLAGDTSPADGETQTISAPVAGEYAVSFSYTGTQSRYGESFELRLSRNGATNTLATIAAQTAGTFSTNFTYAIGEAGDWELSVYVPSGASSAPATVSGFSISIPDTAENRKLYWVYETMRTLGSTGVWSGDGMTIGDGKIEILGPAGFEPASSPQGRIVEYTVVARFAAVDEELANGVDPDVKATLCLGRDGSNKAVFMALATENGTNAWKQLGAQGLAEPQTGVDYTLKFSMDATNRTYKVSLMDGAVEIPLESGGSRSFKYANTGADDVRATSGQVEFNGEGEVSLLAGAYRDPSAFSQGDRLALLQDGAVELTGAQAAWLNSMDAYDVVSDKTAAMSSADFDTAYLLNLDLRRETYGLSEFKVSGIEVTDSAVKIAVTLVRTGAMAADGGDAPINGILKLYGGEKPGDKTLLVATSLEGGDFAGGSTAVFTFPRSGNAKFFRPSIVAP